MPMRPPAGFISAFYDPLKNPNAPTIGTATGGDASASVAFTAPSNVGGSAISSYSAISTPQGIIASAASSPISVTGLTNGTAYTFAVWATNTYGPSAFSAASGSVTPSLSRGIFAGGNGGGNVIDYIDITTLGNATDFGDLLVSGTFAEGCASSVRGVFQSGDGSNVLQYVTIASAGNATDFGDMYVAVSDGSATGNNSTRGIFAGGLNSSNNPTNVIQYVTIASLGNSSDFGDLTEDVKRTTGASSPTRTVRAGGEINGGVSAVIDYITTATLGNAANFGNLTEARRELAGAANATRALFFGGRNSSSTRVSTIDYITLASTGNATTFGNTTTASDFGAAVANATRICIAIGFSTTTVNTIEYVTIATTGNALDFGDLTVARYSLGSCSSANGGLQ